MNEPLDEIEAELKHWQPVVPRPAVEARLAAKLDARGPRLAWRPSLSKWFWWAPVGLAALAAVALVWLPPRQQSGPVTRSTEATQFTANPSAPTPSLGGYRPVRMADYLLEARDEGIVYTSATMPFRKVRYQVLSASQWRDDADNVTAQVLVPRENTILIPLNVH